MPCPPPGDLPDRGIEPKSLMSPASAGGFFTASVTWEAGYIYIIKISYMHIYVNIFIYMYKQNFDFAQNFNFA